MRKSFIPKNLLTVFFLIICGNAFAQYQPNWKSLDTRKVPEWFTNAKFGILFIGACILFRLMGKRELIQNGTSMLCVKEIQQPLPIIKKTSATAAIMTLHVILKQIYLIPMNGQT